MVMNEAHNSLSDQDWDEEAAEIEETKNMVFDVHSLRYACKDSDDPLKYIQTAVPYNLCFKLVKSDSRLVKSILFSYGFVQCSPKNMNVNLVWSNTHLNAHTMRLLKSWQRVNHFPRSFLITKKDQLYIQLNRAKIHYGNAFDFIPESYCTPLSEEKRERLKKSLQPSKSSSLYIVKPSNSSRGRGIQFLNAPEQVDEISDSDEVIISRYIHNPCLIQNKKWDLRIYVAVTSFYPLIAYQFTDGLTRFAVDDYDHAASVSHEAHLTNYSLHKTNDKFVKNLRVDQEDFGHKWTLSAALRLLKQEGKDAELLMVRIEDLVIKTLLSVQRVIGSACRKLSLNPNNCFELFGFDILVDNSMKPWLLEVNLSPSLNCDSPLDSLIKSDLVATTLNLARIPMVVEKNSVNKAYILSRRSPSVELSNAVSTTSLTAASDINSASVSPSTDSGYDTLSSNDPLISAPDRRFYGRLSPPRKRNSIKSARQKRASQQQHIKIPNSPMRVVEFQNSRLNLLAEKVREEEKLAGDFLRIFPRPESRAIYNPICEDSGSEHWDLKLGNLLFDSTMEITQRDYEQYHSEIIDAENYQSCESLSENTKKILANALSTADRYLAPFYENDPDCFPQVLPKLRFGLRKRTLSAIDFDLRRRAEVLAKHECSNEEDYLEMKQYLYEQFKNTEGTPRLVN